MIAKTIDTDTVNGNIDLRDLAGRYTELRRESALSLAGPCPRCGGDDRFYVQQNFFACRQCHPSTGDAIEFIMWINNCSFLDAIASLTSATQTHAAAPQRRQAHQRAEQSYEWRRDASERSRRAQWRLADDASAHDARAYLIGRGLVPETWRAFRLGYWSTATLPATWDADKKTFSHPQQPALTIPWYDSSGVCHLGYRFLAGHTYTDVTGRQRTAKKSSLYGGDKHGRLYGDHALDGNIERLSTLLLCEGELNACSIWQASRGTHLDVLSLGSESATITPAIIQRAGRYATVLVWFDREEAAQSAMAVLPGAYGIKSPYGRDANDLLCSGHLGGFLAGHRQLAAIDDHQRRRLESDLAAGCDEWAR